MVIELLLEPLGGLFKMQTHEAKFFNIQMGSVARIPMENCEVFNNRFLFSFLPQESQGEVEI